MHPISVPNPSQKMPHFTDLSVQKLPEGVHFDTKLTGFGVRVGKNRKTWILVKGANRTKVTLGHYPAVSLSEARKLAQEAIVAPTWSKSRISFPEALQAFLTLPKWRPQTASVLRSTIKPFTWKKQVHLITHEDVVQVLESIEKPSARFHAQKDIKTFFNWCIPRYLDVSPCVGLKSEPQPTRDRLLTDDEVKAIWAYEWLPYSDIIKLCILTGQRVGEVTGFNHSWISDGTITIPASVTKNGREHTFPFGSLTQTYLDRYAGNTFSRYSYGKKQIDKATGVTDWVVHDCRRYYSSTMARLGVPLHITELLLNHRGTISGVAATYNRYSFIKEKRDAQLTYEAFIATLVGARA
jgi:integrase